MARPSSSMRAVRLRRRVPRPAERGAALLGAIAILALLGAVTAATLWLAASELWAAGRARALLQARYSAEAGARHAVALLAPGTDFAALLAGQGGLARRSDAGPLPLSGGGWVSFPGPPFGYGVISVEPARVRAAEPFPGERVVLAVRATSVAGAVHTVLATVGRRREPYAPAALVVSEGELVVEPPLGGSGPDDPAAVLIDARQPAGGAQAAVGATSAATAARAAAAGAVLLAARPTAEVMAIDLAGLAAATGLAAVDPSMLADPVGAVDRPAALLVGAGRAPGLAGRGAVVATGDLELQGPIDFHGVVLVDGALRLDGSPCALAGMIWAREVAFTSGCSVRFDPQAIELADGALRLPRRAVLSALLDD